MLIYAYTHKLSAQSLAGVTNEVLMVCSVLFTCFGRAMREPEPCPMYHRYRLLFCEKASASRPFSYDQVRGCRRHGDEA